MLFIVLDKWFLLDCCCAPLMKHVMVKESMLDIRRCFSDVGGPSKSWAHIRRRSSRLSCKSSSFVSMRFLCSNGSFTVS